MTAWSAIKAAMIIDCGAAEKGEPKAHPQLP
jgi:hypothetical protein